MPRLTPTFTVRAPIEEVWDFLTDMERVGSCVPGCRVTRIGSDAYAWRLTARVGLLSRTYRIVTRVVAQDDERHHAEFTGSGEELETRGVVDLTPISDEATAVRFRLSIQAVGPLGAAVNAVILARVDDYQHAFVAAVRERLGRRVLARAG